MRTDDRPKLPSAPGAERRIRELAKDGPAVLRIRHLDYGPLTMVHVHVRVGNYQAAMNVDPYLATHAERFDDEVHRLIDICERRPEPFGDGMSCDCGKDCHVLACVR